MAGSHRLGPHGWGLAPRVQHWVRHAVVGTVTRMPADSRSISTRALQGNAVRRLYKILYCSVTNQEQHFGPGFSIVQSWRGLCGKVQRRSGMRVFEFVPQSHETYGRVGLAAMQFLDRLRGRPPVLAKSPSRPSWKAPCAGCPQRCAVAVLPRHAPPRRPCIASSKGAVLPGLQLPTDELLLQTGWYE